MNKRTYKKFKRKFNFIFKDKEFSKLYKQSFDSEGKLIGCVLALITNHCGLVETRKSLLVQKDKIISIFTKMYLDPELSSCYENIKSNPLQDTSIFSASIINFCKKYNRDIFSLCVSCNAFYKNFSGEKFLNLLAVCYSYIIYNFIEAKIDSSIHKNLIDKNYDQKVSIIINNTKYFSAVKKIILEIFDIQINNIIVLILGMSNPLYK